MNGLWKQTKYRKKDYEAWPDQLDFGSPRWRQLMARVGFKPTLSKDMEKRLAWVASVFYRSNLEWP